MYLNTYAVKTFFAYHEIFCTISFNVNGVCTCRYLMKNACNNFSMTLDEFK